VVTLGSSGFQICELPTGLPMISPITITSSLAARGARGTIASALARGARGTTGSAPARGARGSPTTVSSTARGTTTSASARGLALAARGPSTNLHMDISPDGRWLAAAGGGAYTPISIVDLASLNAPLVQSPEETLQWCELLANARISGSNMVALTTTEWIERWLQYKPRHPEIQLAPSDFLPASPTNNGE
jgi:hypothetical protein